MYQLSISICIISLPEIRIDVRKLAMTTAAADQNS
jgi:hypothetical protein